MREAATLPEGDYCTSNSLGTELDRLDGRNPTNNIPRPQMIVVAAPK